LSDDELRHLGVFFEDRCYGEAIFLLQPGWLFSRSDFDTPQWAPAGMHGYHPDDSYSDAIFLTGQQPEFDVRTIKDVYRCMWNAAQNLVTAEDPEDAKEKGTFPLASSASSGSSASSAIKNL
jgi:hypothetical protein